jgi:hypothetical protein
MAENNKKIEEAQKKLVIMSDTSLEFLVTSLFVPHR